MGSATDRHAAARVLLRVRALPRLQLTVVGLPGWQQQSPRKDERRARPTQEERCARSATRGSRLERRPNEGGLMSVLSSSHPRRPSSTAFAGVRLLVVALAAL